MTSSILDTSRKRISLNIQWHQLASARSRVLSIRARTRDWIESIKRRPTDFRAALLLTRALRSCPRPLPVQSFRLFFPSYLVSPDRDFLAAGPHTATRIAERLRVARDCHILHAYRRALSAFTRVCVRACVRLALRAKCRLSPWSGRWVRAGSAGRWPRRNRGVQRTGGRERTMGRVGTTETSGARERASRSGGRRGKRPFVWGPYSADLGRVRLLSEIRAGGPTGAITVFADGPGWSVSTNAQLSGVDSEFRELCQSAKGGRAMTRETLEIPI